MILVIAALCITREPLLVFSIVVAGFIAIPAAALVGLDAAGATDDRVLLHEGQTLRETIIGRLSWVLLGAYLVGYAAFLLGIVTRMPGH